ncbi:DDE-type integrase/transposase/recombinase [Bacillus megaterium]|nr:DDE-type integrase/transposase/recombinase [Priestia megaterium]
MDFYINKTRNTRAVKHFLRKLCGLFHVSKPRVFIVVKNPAWPIAIEERKKMPVVVRIRQVTHLNNIMEQDHLFIKK